MKGPFLDDLLQECIRPVLSQRCTSCGRLLLPRDDDFCSLCGFAHRLAYSIELKGGDTTMGETKQKEEEPDFKGSFDVSAWMSFDSHGRKLLTIKIGKVASLP